MEFSIDINALHKAIKVLGIVVRTNSTDTTCLLYTSDAADE